MAENGDSSVRKLLQDIAIKILFVTVPLMGVWIVKLEVTNATQDLKIEQLEKDLAAQQASNADIVDIKVAIGNLDTRVSGMNDKVDKIYDSLLR